ncbi:cytochrome c oxidase assembly protein COX16 homolog, mitochondrial-like isoform X2 [Physella acuta]|nr:cytochrome c oxidase assembly protein COX16 homolog, mitochondrial-like isoform X2 [Physella acuta]
MAESIRNAWANVMRRRFIRLGIPFVVFVAGGSFFLKQFASLRYEFRNSKRLSKEEAEELGFKTVSVDTEIEKMLKEIEEKDLDNWENIRGPRPWEDSKSVQIESRKLLEQQKSKEVKS